MKNDLKLQNEFKVIKTIGPSPIPPVVISKTVSLELRTQIRKLFLEMGEDPQGRKILNRASIRSFVSVDDADYDPIRQADSLASHYCLAVKSRKVEG